MFQPARSSQTNHGETYKNYEQVIEGDDRYDDPEHWDCWTLIPGEIDADVASRAALGALRF